MPFMGLLISSVCIETQKGVKADGGSGTAYGWYDTHR
jgi:hypothetical protein